ncbi:transcriptional regulator, IclR family [Azospirillum oryzae]|uniref:Transcriptional regulator, IclR family n=1 Tax=Azospirillum oryzae TaxID=286727 RepID=A0A1X7HP87_9PROT|nr:IclR family transcriptional regulator C-terminal domain-containing protein [Azospirillum oryzae]SMF89470.1 transcriptional regulator, IclR family [Azospirillum oryzae]
MDLDDSEKPVEFVEGLAKGLAVIEAFDADHGEMTLSEVARRIDASPSSARRSLLTLMALGYVGQKNKRFHLRPKVMALGSAYYVSARIEELLKPELKRMVDTYGDASSVGTLDGTDVIYIAHVSVQHARRATAVIGARYPAHATSLGRVLLSGLSDTALDAYLDKMTPQALTRHTVTDKNALRTIILQARADGYATTVDQLDYGITALAVPIHGTSNEVVAAVNSSGYTGLLTPQTLVDERLFALRAAATAISATIARYPVLSAAIGP